MKKLLCLLFVSLGSAFAQSHSVTLTWSDTANPAGTTYNAYRLTGTCPTTPPVNLTGFTKQNSSVITPKTFVDPSVTGGTTYCYVVTAANTTDESAPSAAVQARVPSVFPPVMIQITILQ